MIVTRVLVGSHISYLPLTVNSGLVGNGLHDVGMADMAIEPSREFCLKALISPETLILSQKLAVP
jgi:hypothetical protein